MSAPSSPGRCEHAERERVEHLDRARSPVVGHAEQVAHRLEDPVDVGVLHDDRRHVGTDLGRAAAPVREPRRPPARTPLPCRRPGACRRVVGRRPRTRGPGLDRGLEPCSRPRPARSPRRRATRSRPRARSTRRSSTGTRTASAARPARAPAGTACTTCRTPNDPRAPRRRSGRSGRRRLRRRSTPAGRCSGCVTRAPACRRPAPSRRRRRGCRAAGRGERRGGMSANRSSTLERPRVASISLMSSSVCGANLTTGSLRSDLRDDARAGHAIPTHLPSRTWSRATGSRAGRRPCTGSPGTAHGAAGPCGSSS